MTIIHFKFVDGYHTPSVGHLAFMPHRRQASNEVVDLPKPFTRTLVNGELEVDLIPNSEDWVWSVTKYVQGYSDTYFYSVPDLPGIIHHTELTPISPSTLPQAHNAIEPAWWAEIRQYKNVLREAMSQNHVALDRVDGVVENVQDLTRTSQRHESTARGYARQTQQNAEQSRYDWNNTYEHLEIVDDHLHATRRNGEVTDTGKVVPTFVEGTTTQLNPSEAANVDLERLSSTTYRVDFQVPRGLDGDPTAVADFGEAFAVEVNTEGSAGQTALNAQTANFAESQLGLITPTSPTFDQLQAAATAASQSGKTLIATGTLTTDRTLVLRCNFNLTTLTINYTGTGTAVQIGDDDALTQRITGTLPKITRNDDVGFEWFADTPGSDTVGLKVTNLLTSNITIPHIRNFGVGMLNTAVGRGHVHNEYHLGHLDNNKVNQKFDVGSGGWVTENIYINGRFSHNNAGTDTPEPGLRQIDMVYRPDEFGYDNLVWVKPSLEGNKAEYHVNICGRSHLILQGRWETRDGIWPKVHWGYSASSNVIEGGYGVHTIRETFDEGAQMSNQIRGPYYTRANLFHRAYWHIEGATDIPVLMMMSPETRRKGGTTFSDARFINGTDSPNVMAIYHDRLEGKKNGDQAARTVINWAEGDVRSETVTATKYHQLPVYNIDTLPSVQDVPLGGMVMIRKDGMEGVTSQPLFSVGGNWVMADGRIPDYLFNQE